MNELIPIIIISTLSGLLIGLIIGYCWGKNDIEEW